MNWTDEQKQVFLTGAFTLAKNQIKTFTEIVANAAEEFRMDPSDVNVGSDRVLEFLQASLELVMATAMEEGITIDE